MFLIVMLNLNSLFLFLRKSATTGGFCTVAPRLSQISNGFTTLFLLPRLITNEFTSWNIFLRVEAVARNSGHENIAASSIDSTWSLEPNSTVIHTWTSSKFIMIAQQHNTLLMLHGTEVVQRLSSHLIQTTINTLLIAFIMQVNFHCFNAWI